MLIASCLEGTPKNLRQVIGDQNLPGVLTFFRGKPDNPRKVKRYCRPEVGGRESGPGNVTDLLHREAGQPEEEKNLQVCCRLLVCMEQVELACLLQEQTMPP